MLFSVYLEFWKVDEIHNPSLSECFKPLSEALRIDRIKKLLGLSPRPPLWSSGQSSWLQIRRPGFESRHYQEKKVVGLERSPLSLVNTTEELLDRKVAAPV
jgi:hypothetical protein